MNFQITMALMATKVFDKGASEYGLLGSIMAIGSLAAALLAARRKVPRLRVLLLALAGFTVASGIAALAPTYWLFALRPDPDRPGVADRPDHRQRHGPARGRRPRCAAASWRSTWRLHGRHPRRRAAHRLDR